MQKDNTPIDNNSKEPYKFYALVKLNEKVSSNLCENCKNSNAIGKFLKINFEDIEKDKYYLYDFKRNFEILYLCESCYSELKSKEYIPPFLTPLIEFSRTKNIIECINQLELNLENKLLYLAQDNGILKDNDDIEKLKNLSTLDKANLIRDLLTQELFSYNVFGDMLYILNPKGDKGDLYFIRDNVLIKAEDIIKSLLNKLFPNILTLRATEEIIPKIKEYAKKIDYNEYIERLNPKGYVRLRDFILDLENLELIQDLEGYYFSKELPYNLNMEYFQKLKELYLKAKRGEISYWDFEKEGEALFLQFYKEGIFYKSFRRFFDEVDWYKLKLFFGKPLSNRDDKNRKRGIFIKGDVNTGKSTLMKYYHDTLEGYVRMISWSELDPKSDKHRLSFMKDEKYRVFWIDEDPEEDKFNPVVFKAYISAVMLSIRPMHHSSIEIVEKPIIVVTSNYTPRFKEYDETFTSKLVVIRTINGLKEGEIDPDLSKKLETHEAKEELFHYILYCILLYNLDPAIPQDEDELYSLLMEGEDRYHVKDFLETLPKGSNLQVERKELFNEYVEWFRENYKLKKEAGRNTFYDIVEKYGYKVKENEGIRYFQGIDLPKKKKGNQESLI